VKRAFIAGATGVESWPGAERADLERRLARAEESRTWLLRLISELIHEASQPLTVLYGELQLALESGPDEDEHRALLQASTKQVDLLIRLVQRARELARAEKSIELSRGTSILETVRAAMETLQSVAESKQVKLVLQTNTDAAVAIPADRLEHVVDLLVNLALERSSDGAAVFLTTTRTAAAVSLCVADQGAGLSPEQVALLLDPLAHNRERRASFVECDLGWCLTKRIAEAWGGSFRMESGLEGGCSATLTLPLWLSEE